jgi:6-phosphogluconolactonase (cycloisomerase 2 family)
LAEYDISSGALTAISDSPHNLNFIPVALSVAPSNLFLYVATIPGAASPGIFLYSIGSSGALTVANGGSALVADTIASMDISPDGNFLFTVSNTGQTMNEYQVNKSTGGLTFAASVVLPGFTCALTGTPASQACTVKVSPSGQFVVVALGTQGDVIFPYSSTNGLTGAGATQILSGNGSTVGSATGDFSLALDKNNFAYIARTAALAVYSIDASGTPTQRSTFSYASGVTPRSVTLSSSDNYVYTANEGAGTISEFAIASSGALTQLTGSPVAAPASVSALGVDKTGAYLVAAGYNSSNGVQLFAIGTDGTLSLKASAASGTSTGYPAVLAMTH